MSDDSRVVAVIPARYASTRFPGKPLVPVLGVPLVLRVHARVAAAIPPERVIVATDDERIGDVCRAAGVQVTMTSPRCATGTDRVWEVARALDVDVVLNVQGDEPMIAPADVLAVLDEWRRHGHGVANAMCTITEPADIASASVPKVVVAADGRLRYASRAAIPFVHGSAPRPVYRRQVCIYAFGRRELATFASHGGRSPLEAPEDIEILRCLDLGIPVHMVEVSGASLAVDYPADVARVEAALARDAAPA